MSGLGKDGPLVINKARLEQLWFLWLIQGLEQENFPHKNFPPSSNSALQTSFSFFNLGYDFGQSGSAPQKPNSLTGALERAVLFDEEGYHPKDLVAMEVQIIMH